MNSPKRSALLTYQEAAEVLGVSDRSVWAMVNRGELTAVRMGGRTVRIDPLDLEEFIAKSKQRKPAS